jgi:ribonuclease BN (tRNA processing enzyme)
VEEDSGKKITFLGTGDAFSSGGKNMSAIFIQEKEVGLLLDCGPSTLPALNSKGLTTNDINIIVITHFHGDHFGGIPFILLEASRKRARTDDLLIIGPQTTEKRIKRLYSELYSKEASQPLTFKLNFKEVKPDRSYSINTAKGRFQLTTFKSLHTPDSLAYCLVFDSGIRISYTGDTGWTNDLVTLAQGCSILITECSSYDVTQPTHLNFQQITKLKTLANPNLFALVHLSDDMLILKARGKIDSAYILPEDGDTLIINR